MSYKLIFHPEATVEYVAASIWYAEKQHGLDERFEIAVERVLHIIANNPDIYSAAKSGYRQAVVNDFPYVIVYRIDTTLRHVYVVAIYDTHRNPKGKYR